MVKAGLLLPHEAVRLAAVDDRTPHETTWFANSSSLAIISEHFIFVMWPSDQFEFETPALVISCK
jgi:hypothetical protein